MEYLKNYELDLNLDNLNYCDKYYTRNLLYSDKQFDIYCIHWRKGHKSKIHSHPKNGCLMKIISGKLKECRYNNDIDKISERELNKNECGYMEGNDILHDIEAIDDTISIHIYSPPKFIPQIYAQKNNDKN